VKIARIYLSALSPTVWQPDEKTLERREVARKLAVAVWHLLMGHPIGALDRLDTLQTKLAKFATELGPTALAAFGYKTKAHFVANKLYVLQSYP